MQPTAIVSTRPIVQLEWHKDDIVIVLTKLRAYFVNSITMERNKVYTFPDANFTRILFNAQTDILYGSTDREIIVLWPPEPANANNPACLDAVRVKEDFLRTHAATMINPQQYNRANCDDVNDFDDTIRCVDISTNGQFMCICSSDGILFLRQRKQVRAWKPYRFLRLPSAEHTRCRFIPTTDAQLQLLLISSRTDSFILEAESLWCTHLQSSDSTIETISLHGTKFCLIEADGYCRIFNTLPTREKFANHQAAVQLTTQRGNSARLLSQLEALLPRERLERQLEEHHSYPADHRALIWQTVLSVPRNDAAFARLLSCGPHPCAEQFDRKYPLKDRTAARHLLRIVSALAHWCPPIAGLEYLPRFVFPFLCVYPYSIRGAFETIATLMLNHGQMLLEFSAAAPPANYLAICENLLAHFEPRLHQFYKRNEVPRQLYIGSLLEPAFTEVLDKPQWLRLWDHICTRPAWWLPFGLVAFNVELRNAVLSSSVPNARAAVAREACEVLFAEHAHDVDIARLVRRADQMASECPKELDPRQYMEDFRTLGVTIKAGNQGDGDGADAEGYRKFTNYPRFVAADCANRRFNGGAARATTVRCINDKLLEMERLKNQLKKVAAEGTRCQKHDALLAEAERLYAESVRVGEERK